VGDRLKRTMVEGLRVLRMGKLWHSPERQRDRSAKEATSVSVVGQWLPPGSSGSALMPLRLLAQ
jgi:hypothetical protein